MSQPPDLGTLRLHDDDDDDDDDDSDQEDIFDGMDEAEETITIPDTSLPQSIPSRHDRQQSQDDRDAALRKELESVKAVNKVIEGVIASLEKAKGNMNTVHTTVQSASTLLNTWTRILSQTEHNQRLILNPNWQGATQDLEDIGNEAVMRQQAAERRAHEEQARREAAARRAEEEERRKTLAPTTAARGARPRGRGTVSSRLTGPSTSTGQAYVGVGGQGGRGRASARAASGIGRGTLGTRGTRGRGLG